jgi:anti-sigma factor RsiW
MECTRPDMSERLIMALWPEDFPEERQEIQEHVKSCPVCQKELAMLQNLRKTIHEHSRELADCVSTCSSATEVVEFSLGGTIDSTLQEHIERCPECSEQLNLVKQLQSEKFPAAPSYVPTSEEKIIIRNAVAKEYRQPRSAPASSFSAFFRLIFSSIHVPSVVLGAAAAAILVVVVMLPHAPDEAVFKLALSDMTWESLPQASTRSGEVFDTEAVRPKKVAAVILISETLGLSQAQIDHLYEDLSLGMVLPPDDELVSPSEVKKSLELLASTQETTKQIAPDLLRRIGSDFLLLFEISGSGESMKVTGVLLSKVDGKAVPPISQAALSRAALANSIKALGTALLVQREAAE